MVELYSNGGSVRCRYQVSYAWPKLDWCEVDIKRSTDCEAELNFKSSIKRRNRLGSASRLVSAAFTVSKVDTPAGG